MKIATGIVCAVHILSIVVVNSSFVSKYSKPSRATKRCKVNFVMEKFVSGFCKKGDRDLTLYSITASQCIQECRARTECKSINMFTRVNICKINFESNLTLEKCKYYFHSDKANWTQKTEPGCESLNCSLIQKCIKKDGKYSCAITECVNVFHLPNGMVFGNHMEINITRAFMCNHGYELNGQSLITCQADGSWSHDVPVCVAKHPVKLDNSQTTEPSTPNQTTSSVHSLTSKETSETRKTSQEVPSVTTSSTTETSRGTTTEILSEARSKTTSISTSTNTSPDTTSLKTSSQRAFNWTVSKDTQLTKSVAIDTSTGTTSDISKTSNGSPNHSCPTKSYLESDNCGDNTCPFPEVFDPRKNQCVDACENFVYGTTYQVHQSKDFLIGLSVLNALDMSTNNLDECFVTCRGMKNCTAISRRPGLPFSINFYTCTFFVILNHAELSITDFEEHTVYLRNCQDSDQNGQYPVYLTAAQCEHGKLFSHSQEACLLACAQTFHTFQLIDDHGINRELMITKAISSVLSSLTVEHFMTCLEECLQTDICAVVFVTRSAGEVKCDFFASPENYNNLLTPDPFLEVFLRDCE